MFANKSGQPRAFIGRLVTSGISPPLLRLWLSNAKYCFFKRRTVDTGTVKCRDAFIRPCSTAYRPIFERSSGAYVNYVCGVVFLRAFGCQSSIISFSCETRDSLVGSNKSLFRQRWRRPRRGQACRGSEIAQQRSRRHTGYSWEHVFAIWTHVLT